MESDLRRFVTDHALVRYMERSLGLDTKTIAEAMVTETVQASILAGARAVTSGGWRYTIDPIRQVIVTIQPEVGSRQRQAQYAKRRFRTERVGGEE